MRLRVGANRRMLVRDQSPSHASVRMTGLLCIVSVVRDAPAVRPRETPHARAVDAGELQRTFKTVARVCRPYVERELVELCLLGKVGALARCAAARARMRSTCSAHVNGEPRLLSRANERQMPSRDTGRPCAERAPWHGSEIQHGSAATGDTLGQIFTFRTWTRTWARLRAFRSGRRASGARADTRRGHTRGAPSVETSRAPASSRAYTSQRAEADALYLAFDHAPAHARGLVSPLSHRPQLITWLGSAEAGDSGSSIAWRALAEQLEGTVVREQLRWSG